MLERQTDRERESARERERERESERARESLFGMVLHHGGSERPLDQENGVRFTRYCTSIMGVADHGVPAEHFVRKRIKVVVY